jgi:hypothetical protein
MTKKRCVLYLSVFAFLIVGCLPEPPTRTFSTRELLINVNAFPQGWIVASGPQGAIQNRRQIDGAYVGFEVQEPHLLVAQHEIFRYRSKQEA